MIFGFTASTASDDWFGTSLCAAGSYLSINCFIFSSLVNEEMRRKGESLGADAQLTKPEIGSLVEAIDELIAKKNQ